MKLQDYREFFDSFSGKASDVSRQLAFAEIAIVWTFAVGKENDKKILDDMLWPAIALVAFLATDFLQYASASVVWGVYYRHLERRHKDTANIPRHSVLLTWPQFGFFWLKLGLFCVAYVLMLRALVHRVLA